MSVLVTSLLGVSQTLDGVALGAFTKQVRAGTAASLTTALAAAVVAKQITAVDIDVPGGDILIAAKTVLAGESGKTFFLDLAAGFVVTLPLPSLGLKYSFVAKTAPTGTYTIVSNASANIIKGSIVTPATGAADTETAGGDTVSFVAATAVAGDRVDVVSDGVSWHVEAICSVATGITITTAS